MTWKNRIVGYGNINPRDIKFNPDNPNVHNETQETFMESSLEELGWIAEVTINKTTGHLLDGEMRVKRAVENNQDSIPVKYVELTPEEELEALASLVYIPGYSKRDEEKTKHILENTNPQNENFQRFMNSIAKKSSIDIEKPPQIEISEEHEESSIQVSRGDIWEITGKSTHYLACIDSTNQDEVRSFLGNVKSSLVITDPPYGVGYAEKSKSRGEGRGTFADVIINENLTEEQARSLIKSSIECWSYNMSKNSSYYVWSPQMELGYQFMLGMKDNGIQIKAQIIWVKNNFSLGHADYQWKHEMCWYGNTGDPKWFGMRDQSTVWDAPMIITNRIHPNQKPVDLFMRAMYNNSEKGDVVFDPFAGSCPCIVAADNLERTCYCADLDPDYVAPALENLSKTMRIKKTMIGIDKIYYEDCLEGMKKIDDNSIDLIVSSPPYFNLKEYSQWNNYNDYMVSVNLWFMEMSRVLKNGRYIFWNIQDSYPNRLFDKKSERKHIPLTSDTIVKATQFLKYEYNIIWYKGKAGATQRMFGSYPYPPTLMVSWLHENILVFKKSGKAIYKRNEESKITKEKWVQITNSLWEIQPETHSKHSAAFPLEIPKRAIEGWSLVGDIIVDPFMGSGTTAIACLETNRHYIGFENNEQYFNIANNRIEERIKKL